jgi:hypothetical protein
MNYVGKSARKEDDRLLRGSGGSWRYETPKCCMCGDFAVKSPTAAQACRCGTRSKLRE